MTGSIRIAQITDCHLPAKPQQRYRDIYPYENLKNLLQKVRQLQPDLLLASGDLSEDGSRASYQALRRFLLPLDIPVLALPGNHDDPGLLAEMFPGSPVDKISVSEHGVWQIIRLNSCVEGKPEGHLSEKTLAELERLLQGSVQCHRLIAIHHQPVCVGSPWIDKYRLFDTPHFLQLIDQHPDVKIVAWGHVHQSFEADRGGIAMLGGPSSAINCLPGTPAFTPDPVGPSFRWLELKPDGSFSSIIIGV